MAETTVPDTLLRTGRNYIEQHVTAMLENINLYRMLV